MRMIVVSDSAPLVDAKVHVQGRESALRTDQDGMVDLGETPSGPLEVSVLHAEEWSTCSVDARDSQTLLVVDITRRPSTGDFLGRGTLELGDRYEYRRVLGRGGMGVVIEAQDTVLQRSVAIKMLNDELQENREARQILLTEGQALARLSHPNLVAVYDVASANGRVFMVLEFVEGKTVEEVISANGALDPALAVRAITRLIQALMYLHSKGIIHRDVKPANLMFKPDGELKLIDFGLARSLERIQKRGTRVRGSPAYMAPEQIQGEELSPATDMYQVGVTMFEMLTSQLPFSDGSLGYAHVHRKPPTVWELRPELDEKLCLFVSRCLSKRPSERPTTAQALHLLAEVESKFTHAPKLSSISEARSDPAERDDLKDEGRSGERLSRDAVFDRARSPSRWLLLGSGLLLGCALILVLWNSSPGGEEIRYDDGVEPSVVSLPSQDDAPAPAAAVQKPKAAPPPTADTIVHARAVLGLARQLSQREARMEVKTPAVSNERPRPATARAGRSSGDSQRPRRTRDSPPKESASVSDDSGGAGDERDALAGSTVEGDAGADPAANPSAKAEVIPPEPAPASDKPEIELLIPEVVAPGTPPRGARSITDDEDGDGAEVVVESDDGDENSSRRETKRRRKPQKGTSDPTEDVPFGF